MTARILGTWVPNSPEWLQARIGRIGGSDVATICGWSPWTTRAQLLDDKLGTPTRRAMSAAMDRGNRLEAPIIGWLLDHKYVYRDQKNKLMPYAAKNNGLFEVKEGKGRHNDWARTQTLITPKGRETFRLLCKEPPVLPQFTEL